MKMPYPFFILLFAILFTFCNQGVEESVETPKSTSATALADAPEWAKEVVWYQIFLERFRNGDSSNDPTAEDIIGAYPGFVPENWQLTPWTHDWYKPDPYFDQVKGRSDLVGNKIEHFGQLSRLRRYGGDLQGVFDKIGYLDSLGITAIYFNPLNDAPSDHKYDARHWRHIDHNFGPSPRRDIEIMAQETPDDPGTWQMTGADSMFVALIDALHQRGIRVILDYSWNHTGMDCWAWRDILEKGASSKFADWYWVEQFDDPATPENEFKYEGWFGVADLPEIRETVKHDHIKEGIKAYEGNVYSEAVKQHIFNISKRWLDPNGDGDPSDGVDGFRLDVAAEIGLDFWREYREEVRSVNPEAYLLGEVWWEEWPDKLLDPEPFLKGDVFDAVMNYRWYRSVRHFFAKAPNEIPPSELVDSLQSFTSNLRPENNYVMMNLAASHDSPRLATSLFNKNKYKYLCEPSANPNYKINKPDVETRRTQRLLLAQQYTYIGAPHIWAGDEMGMWGADMGDTRKPLIWPDYEFEDENTHPLGLEHPNGQVKFDAALFTYYQQLIQIRKDKPVLAKGDIEYVLVDDKKQILAYSRFNEQDEVLAVFNNSNAPYTIQVPVKTEKQYTDLLGGLEIARTDPKTVELLLPERSAAILGNKND